MPSQDGGGGLRVGLSPEECTCVYSIELGISIEFLPLPGCVIWMLSRKQIFFSKLATFSRADSERFNCAIGWFLVATASVH